jgi:DNA-binding HxlR family transcriptional regulator
MTEIFFFILTLAILGYHAWYVKQHDQETKMLTKALLSKDLKDFTESEIREKKVGKQEPPKNELIELNDLSDEQFGKVITNQLNDNG